jgi:hypothetical protein
MPAPFSGIAETPSQSNQAGATPQTKGGSIKRSVTIYVAEMVGDL